ncbi:hypothetical protein QUW35_00465 [Ligilactobacillus agilis]|uniref:hypothetical protein n=1 Tax=Ligilactobacillus agilis TaxID=1601 RepID=UPI0025A4411A|nr:hypothetical protein [Ligilactobacillus agilis]MDM8279169.1 hypothetical protein [Ligilactobacillus agilis]
MEADGYTNADLVNLLSEGIELRSLVESATMTNEQIFLPKQRTLELVRSYTDDIKAFILYVCDGPLVKEHITSIQAKIDDEDQAAVKGSKSNSDLASAALLSGKSSDDLLSTESDTDDKEVQDSSDDEATVSDDSSKQSIAGLKIANVDTEVENVNSGSSLDIKDTVTNRYLPDALSKEKQQRQAFVTTNPLVSVETDSDDSSNNVEDIDDSSVSELEDTVVDDVSEGKEHNFSDNVEDISNKEQFSDTNTVVEPKQHTDFEILNYADLDESTGIFRLNDNFEKVEINSNDFKAPIISDIFREAMLYQLTAICKRVDENGEYYDNTDRGVYKPLSRFADSIVKGVTVDGERVYAFNIRSLRDNDDIVFDSSIWVTEESYQALLAAYAKYDDSDDDLFDKLASGFFDDNYDSWTDSVHINGYAVSLPTSTSSNEDDSDFLL